MTTATAKPVSNGHRLVTLAELLDLPKPYEDVPLPELGGATIRLYAVDGIERARLAGVASATPDDAESQALFTHAVIAACMEDATPESVGKLPGRVIDRLGPVALRLCGIGAAAIEAAVAALKETPSAESGTA